MLHYLAFLCQSRVISSPIVIPVLTGVMSAFSIPNVSPKHGFPKLCISEIIVSSILFANKRKALKLSRKGGLWEATKGARNNQQLATLCSLIWQHVVNKTAKLSVTLTEYNYCVSLIQLTMNTQGWLTQRTCFQNKHFGFKMVQTIHSVACGPEAAVTVFNTDFFFSCLFKDHQFLPLHLILFCLFYFLPYNL